MSSYGPNTADLREDVRQSQPHFDFRRGSKLNQKYRKVVLVSKRLHRKLQKSDVYRRSSRKYKKMATRHKNILFFSSLKWLPQKIAIPTTKTKNDNIGNRYVTICERLFERSWQSIQYYECTTIRCSNMSKIADLFADKNAFIPHRRM